MATDLPPQTAQALRSLAEGLGGHITCLLTPADDMEAYAARENLRYEERRRLYYERYWARVDRRTWRRDTARKLTQPLLADGRAYRRRCLARRRRSR